MHPHTRGRLTEALATAYYALHGYFPAPRPPRLHAQIDLLLQRPFTKHLLLVEVKYRRTPTSTSMALSPAQIQRQRQTATQLTRYYPHHTIAQEVFHLTQKPFKIQRLPLTA